MLNKLLEGFGSSNKKRLLQKVLHSISLIRGTNSILCLYGSPTEGNWLGIANATKGLFPKNAVEVPQWFSNTKFSQGEVKTLCKGIAELNFEKIIISGFANYFFDWIDLLSAHTSTEIIFHGTISEFHDPAKQEFIGKMIQYGKSGKIKRFGFVKEQLDNVFRELYGFDCYHQPLAPPVISSNPEKLKLDPKKIHVGVFGGDTFNKNLHNQVIHTLMMKDTIVHVLDSSLFSYLDMGERIIGHGKNLSKEKFLSLLSSMDINLYMSYSESWGLVYFESEALGVPCLRLEAVDYHNEIKTFIDQVDKKFAN
ncbi:hypothetical protein ACFLR1_00870 [Bacteroidota bacterium]